MISFAEEILVELPAMMVEHPLGPTVGAISRRMAADAASVRRAMAELDVSGFAILVRRAGERAFRLVPADAPIKACRVCHAEFIRRKKSKAVTCSRACAVALAWRNPESAARRVASIKAERGTPEARERQAQNNAVRWARPGERERMGEHNRRRWKDPITKAEVSASIRKTHGSAKTRALHSRRRKEAWENPETRERTVAGIRRSKQTPEARAKFSALLKARWQDPVLREKYLSAARRNGAKGGPA